MALEIRAVRGNRDLDRFVGLARKIYADDPNWVAPLNRGLKDTLTPGRSPFWQHAERELFLAWRNGRAVGRIAAIDDRNYNSYHNSSIGFFGFFESVNDPEVTRALLGAAEAWCRDRGLVRLFGPANPSMNDECGLLVEPFDSPPLIKTCYNPPWYAGLIEAAGYARVKDLYAYRLDLARKLPGKIIRVIEARKAAGGITCRPLDINNLERDLGYITEVYNDAWSRNWDFAPMTQADIDDLARQLRPVVEPELCPLVFLNDEIAAMAIGLPDYNQVLIKLQGRMFPFGWLRFLFARRHISQGRLWALGVKRKYQHLGLGALLYYEAFAGGRRLGYKWGELSWILEDNEAIIRPIRLLGGEHYKTWRIYEKRLEDRGPEEDPALTAG